MIRYVLMGMLLAGPAMGQGTTPCEASLNYEPKGWVADTIIAIRRLCAVGEVVLIPSNYPAVARLCDFRYAVHTDPDKRSVICVLAPERR